SDIFGRGYTVQVATSPTEADWWVANGDLMAREVAQDALLLELGIVSYGALAELGVGARLATSIGAASLFVSQNVASDNSCIQAQAVPSKKAAGEFAFLLLGGIGGGARSGPPTSVSGFETAKVYQLVDEAGEPVYYGLSKDIAQRLADHAS
ncbi:hypothetical protein B7939_12495, partial [Eggerthia catenaformis]